MFALSWYRLQRGLEIPRAQVRRRPASPRQQQDGCQKGEAALSQHQALTLLPRLHTVLLTEELEACKERQKQRGRCGGGTPLRAAK